MVTKVTLVTDTMVEDAQRWIARVSSIDVPGEIKSIILDLDVDHGYVEINGNRRVLSNIARDDMRAFVDFMRKWWRIGDAICVAAHIDIRYDAIPTCNVKLYAHELED